MTHVDEDGALVGGDAGGREEASIFGFESRRANNRDAGGVGGDGMAKEDELGVVTIIAAEEVMAACNAAGVWAGQVRCVRHDPKDQPCRRHGRHCAHWDGRRRSRADVEDEALCLGWGELARKQESK